MTNTTIMQGEYKQADTPVDKNIVLRSNIDWMEVVNWTQSTTNRIDCGTHYYWQRGMTDGIGLCYYHPAATTAIGSQACAAGSGFTLIDSSDTAPGGARAVTGVSNAVNPVVTAANTDGLQVGSIVRLSAVAAIPTVCGFDFQVGAITAGVNFTTAYNMATAPGAAGIDGFYRHVPYDPIFYPRYRFIFNITQAANAIVHTSVDHGYKVGQKIRINLPDANFGMTQINKVEGIVTVAAVATPGQFTTNIDTTGFTAFQFALPAVFPVSFPTVVPVGIDMGTAITGNVDVLSDATYNTSYIGMKLHVGVLAGADLGTLSPAGSNVTTGAGNGDIMKWRAGKSFSNLNEL